MKFSTILLQFLFICVYSCTQKQQKQIKTDFEIDVCNAIYKDKPIPFDKPINDWVELFGKYDRCIDDFYYVWDSLGITLVKSNFSKNGTVNIEENPDALFINFENLSSTTLEDNKLEFSSPVVRKILRRNERNEYYVYAQNELYIPLGNDSLHYQYSTSIYPNTVLIDGSIVSGGMSLKEVNNYRTQIKGNGKMGYWDRDGDWKSERGSTNVKTGEFIDFDRNGKNSECGLTKNYHYQPTLRFTEGILEYIKVEKVVKGKSTYWYVSPNETK